MRLNLVKLAVLAVAISFVSSPAMAVLITPGDFGAIGDLGFNCGLVQCDGQLFPATTDTFISPGETEVGSLTNQMFYNENTGIWTYAHTALPSEGFTVTLFSTGFAVRGFSGAPQSAGWWFQTAANNGMNGDIGDFTVDYQGDGSLDWVAQVPWDPGTEGILFYFRSTERPGTGPYNLGALTVGTAQSYAPVPEPGTLLLLGLGLAGVGVLGRKYRR